MSTAIPSLTDSAELKDRIDRFQKIHQDIVREVRKVIVGQNEVLEQVLICLLYTSPSPRDGLLSRMPSSA